MDSSTPPINRFEGKYSFLSNFSPHPVLYAGSQWATAEHAYQAAKTLEVDQWLAIRKAPTPGKAKRLGRPIERGGIVTLRPDWENVKVSVMHAILESKFSSGELSDMLLSTEDARLEEGNNWGDTFWGVDIATGKGQNMLGRILMQIREEKRSFD